MIIINYSSDSERKRLEYALEKAGGGVQVRRPGGSILIVRGGEEEVGGLLSEILSRIPEERVEVYKLVDHGLRLPAKRLEGVVESPRGAGELWGILDYIMVRLRGVLVSSLGNSKKYRVSGRGGSAEVVFDVEDRGGVRMVRFRVEGFGAYPEELFRRLERELSYLEVGR